MQLTVRKEIREKLNINPEDRVLLELDSEGNLYLMKSKTGRRVTYPFQIPIPSKIVDMFTPSANQLFRIVSVAGNKGLVALVDRDSGDIVRAKVAVSSVVSKLDREANRLALKHAREELKLSRSQVVATTFPSSFKYQYKVRLRYPDPSVGEKGRIEEIDMGSNNTLIDFVDEVSTRYPSIEIVSIVPVKGEKKE